jgi:hypothetical protein
MRHEALAIVTICAAVVLAACDYSVEYENDATFVGPKTRGSLNLRFGSGPDEWNGPDAIGFYISVRNDLGAALSNCRIAIDESYEASLEKLEVYYGFWRGNQPRANAGLVTGAELKLKFHHDSNNHIIVQSRAGDYLSTTTSPKMITLACTEGQVSWVLTNAA